ncbi:MAG: hypothetical protein KUG75_09960, partial [Pseudomonadales bacterium]|nr:hypothetical protein [Pseudomonadales bacterium]
MYKLSPGQAVPPDYYAEKFRIMLDSIVRQYADLLSPKEKRFIHSFRYAISVDSQRLYARLATRKGLLFRLDSFHYSEIDSLERCLQELSDAGLIQMFSRSAADILLTKFTKAELLRSFPSIPTSQLKAKCISPIVNRYSDHFIRSKLQSNFAWVFRQGNQILTTIQILFFGNALMNYSVFVLEDLGIQLFEKYWIDTESRLFQTREALDMYLLLLTYNEWVYKLKQNWNKSQAEYLLTKLAQPLQHRLLVRAKSQQILAISREAERKGCFTL